MDPIPPRKDKKGPAPDTRACGNCFAPQGSASAPKLSACARCGLVAYCSKECQRAHWKANHKQFCIAKVDRAPPPQATPNAPEAVSEERRRAAARAAVVGEECAICLDPLTEASACTLPCAHVFHATCVEEVRKFGVKQVCPMCRTELPPGPGKVLEGALGRYMGIAWRVKRGEASWSALTKAEQQETDEVIRLFRVAALQGHGVAQYNLGLANTQGHGLKQDYFEAAKWYRKAADQGNAYAQCNLGWAYGEGKGAMQDYFKAVKWLRKAANQGNAEAQCNMGTAYAKGNGVKQDSLEAIEWYRKAADQGHARAQFNLGCSYSEGKGAKQDYLEANKWLRKAAEQGHAAAQGNLGNAYHSGEGVKPDSVAAAKWWRKAADKGIPEAQFMIAQYYEHGLGGLSANVSKAIEFHTLAANQGFEPAKEDLERMNRLKVSSFDKLVGKRIKLTGLQAKPEMNGKTGMSKSFSEATGRYTIQLDSGGQPFMLKAANLELMS